MHRFSFPPRDVFYTHSGVCSELILLCMKDYSPQFIIHSSSDEAANLKYVTQLLSQDDLPGGLIASSLVVRTSYPHKHWEQTMKNHQLILFEQHLTHEYEGNSCF